MKEIINLLSKNIDFLEEVIIALIGVLFGAFFTAQISKKSIRQQSKFAIQTDIIKRIQEKTDGISNYLLELKEKLCGYEYNTDSVRNDVDLVLGKLEELRHYEYENQKFVFKILSPVFECLTVSVYSDIWRLFFCDAGTVYGEEEYLNKQLDSDEINDLDSIYHKSEKMNMLLNESFEKLISPGLVSVIWRSIRKYYLYIREEFAAIKVYGFKNRPRG